MDMDSVTTLPGQLFPRLVGRVCATGAINRISALQPQAGACALPQYLKYLIDTSIFRR